MTMTMTVRAEAISRRLFLGAVVGGRLTVDAKHRTTQFLASAMTTDRELRTSDLG
jgi:hypothetical protein